MGREEVMDIPKTLYKYRTWKNDKNNYDYNKDIIIKEEIYFASPKHFNDPFDCKIHMSHEGASDTYIRRRMFEILQKEQPVLSHQQIEDKVNLEMNKRLWENPENLENARIENQNTINKTGIFSVTECNNNILMWSHYADSHKGYCIGLNTEKLEFYFKNKLFEKTKFLIDIIKVKYYKEYPKFRFYEYNAEEVFKKPISSKANDWKYENEYRYYLFEKPDESIHLPPNIIESVYLGCEMPLDDRQEIRRLLATKPYRIKLYQASLEENKFGLQFTEVKF